MSGGLKRVGMAVIGLGRAGQIHFNNVVRNSRIELKWVIEQNQDLARSSLQAYGLDRHVKLGRADDFETVLRDKSIDAVVISTPTDTHADLTIQALRKGKHVMCEKPISEETSKIISCFNEADKHEKVLMATFNRKFDASYRAIYNRVRSGELGDIHFIRSTFRDAPLWLGAHTLSQTFLCHDIDILCWMADGLPETAVCTTTAYTKELIDKNDVDTLVATLKFPSGAIGVLDFSRHSCYGYDIRLEVFGSRGMLTMDAATQHDVFTHKSNGKLHPPLRISFPDRFEKAYVEELDHFIDVIQGKSELLVPRVASERVAYVNDALWESFKTGKVVNLRDQQYS